MKKRILSLMLALVMLLPLGAAGCTPKEGGTETAGTTGADTEKEPIVPIVEDEPFDGYVINASADTYDISDNLFGIFLEDINFAVDGGLYAELVCNRSFEYGWHAEGGNQYSWNSESGTQWSVVNSADEGLNANNTQFARVSSSGSKIAGIYNTGFFDEMRIDDGAEYKFSVYARGANGYSGGLKISVESRNGAVLAEETIDSLTDEWHKYSFTMKASGSANSGARVAVRLDSRGTVDIDMVSLFPADTYKGRENGIRRELGEMLEALEPSFFRFPGGCIIEGSTLEGAYDWKDSIGGGMKFEINGEETVGDVATRPIGDNIWSWNWQPYYSSYGLGFYEYFLLCEDLDCEPVPVVNCGMSCQGQPGPNGVETPDVNGPVFQQYIQDALDLVEFCNGDETTAWGAVRIAMGHEEPFDLHYLGIGNEQWGSEYNKRYALFREAFNDAAESNPELYGDVKLIMANGPLSGSHDGWDVVASEGNDIADVLDEHYYNEPEWFLSASGRYDAYDREAPTVFVGEFAAKSNTSRAAIAEAAYMTSLERNGDVVELAAYAPLFAHNNHTQWTPDLIWFNGLQVWGSVNYYVQKIFSSNQPDSIIRSTVDGSGMSGDEDLSGRIGVGTWATAAKFDDVVVKDNKTGEIIYEEDFSAADINGEGFERVSGSYRVKDGVLEQGAAAGPGNSVAGDVIYFGNSDMDDYTLTLKAKKTAGSEGFLIPFAVTDRDNFWHWNIGGWNNTSSCLQYCRGGNKTVEIEGTVKPFTVETGREYEIKIEVSGYRVRCYIDGELMIDYDTFGTTHNVYTVVGEDEEDIIVKIVNTKDEAVPFRINVSAMTMYEGKGKVETINFVSPETENNNPNKLNVEIDESEADVGRVFNYTVDAYSMVVIRIPK